MRLISEEIPYKFRKEDGEYILDILDDMGRTVITHSFKTKEERQNYINQWQEEILNK